MKILEGNMISDIIRRFHSIVCCNVNYKCSLQLLMILYSTFVKLHDYQIFIIRHLGFSLLHIINDEEMM
jgi:hypothetical protein